jgi:ribonuclease HII
MNSKQKNPYSFKVAGVDEAGKGAVVGSMYVAGVMIEQSELHIMTDLDVRDSKSISPKRREALATEMMGMDVITIHVVEVSANRIDRLREEMTMNDILVIAFSEVLRELLPDKAFVDSVDVNPERFANNIKKRGIVSEIVSEHKADQHYPIVSAASIIAKVSRDRSMRRLEVVVGKRMGSGYPSDQITRRFLHTLVDRFPEDEMPDYVRHSWKTVVNIEKNHRGCKVIGCLS